MQESLESLLEYLDALEGRVDLEALQERVERLALTRADLAGTARFCDEHYQRNLVRRGAWYEAVALCWKPGQSTPIHDHKGSSCCFRVIEGDGYEIGFDTDENGVLIRTHERELLRGTICASQDDDIHEVGNPAGSSTEMITLHIYSPPMTTVNCYTEGSAEVVTEELSAEPAV